MRPVIGITASFCQAIYVHEHEETRQEHQYLYHSYVKAVWAAGGNPMLIPVGIDTDAAIQALRRIDGLLLPGGVDINPKKFNHPPGPNQGRIDPFKDETEFTILRAAIRQMIPIFGICRGIQVIGAALTGTLNQDIESELPWAIKHNFPETDKDSRHEINIQPGSAVHKLLGSDRAMVNSWHHQAVGEIPAEWSVTAEASDGIVEAIEYSLDPLIFAVQWHPEAMIDSDPAQLRLFTAFVNSCKV